MIEGAGSSLSVDAVRLSMLDGGAQWESQNPKNPFHIAEGLT